MKVLNTSKRIIIMGKSGKKPVELIETLVEVTFQKARYSLWLTKGGLFQ